MLRKMAQMFWRKAGWKVHRDEVQSPKNPFIWGSRGALPRLQREELNIFLRFIYHIWIYLDFKSYLDFHTSRQTQGIVANSSDPGAWFRYYKSQPHSSHANSQQDKQAGLEAPAKPEPKAFPPNFQAHPGQAGNAAQQRIPGISPFSLHFFGLVGVFPFPVETIWPTKQTKEF